MLSWLGRWGLTAVPSLPKLQSLPSPQFLISASWTARITGVVISFLRGFGGYKIRCTFSYTTLKNGGFYVYKYQ
jgi:hypothetical protein